MLTAILKKYPYQFFLFGSRAKGLARPFSDVDICYQSDIPLGQVAQIEEEFEESDLPFKVDLVALRTVDEEFREGIERERVLLCAP